MNTLSINILKVLRKTYSMVFKIPELSKPECEKDAEKVSKIIYDKLMEDKPCMIARFGANELYTLVTYLGVKQKERNIVKYIKGDSLPWWWNKEHIYNNLHLVAGFFPPNIEKVEKFCELMLEDIKEIDVLGSWLKDEVVVKALFKKVENVHLRLLEPYWSKEPWTKALKEKRVLVIHPFNELVEEQYKKSRTRLFENPDVLPEFSLLTYKAVQSNGENSVCFSDWFDALEYMENEIDKIEYDICLIGAGAYGLHLAAYVKRKGKKAVHLGGALQLLFGIKGKRWEDPNYGVKEWGLEFGTYSNLINEFWIRPGESEKPKNINSVEGGCYW